MLSINMEYDQESDLNIALLFLLSAELKVMKYTWLMKAYNLDNRYLLIKLW